MKGYREVLAEAQKKKVAIGHFNISNISGMWAIFNTARELDVPIIIGVSEGERDYVGVKQSVALVQSLRDEFDYPVFLNADHTYSFNRVQEAIDAGFDSVIFDGAKLDLEANIAETKKCVDYARQSGRDVLVEGEMGYIGKSSAMLDSIPEGAAVGDDEMTTAEEAKRYVEETGVDLFAPSVGNLHGMLRKVESNPELNITRIKEIQDATNVPLVLHGGSGITDANFTEAIKAGIDLVHINTEIRLAWQRATKIHIDEYPDDIAPYKVGKSAIHAMHEVILEHLKLFNHLG